MWVLDFTSILTRYLNGYRKTKFIEIKIRNFMICIFFLFKLLILIEQHTILCIYDQKGII